jgi:hypothetical protein
MAPQAPTFSKKKNNNNNNKLNFTSNFFSSQFGPHFQMLAGSAPIGGHSMKNNIFIKNSNFLWGCQNYHGVKIYVKYKMKSRQKKIKNRTREVLSYSRCHKFEL